MADRSPEKRDMLLGTGDAVLGLPVPEDASAHYLEARARTEKAIAEGRIDAVAPETTEPEVEAAPFRP